MLLLTNIVMTADRARQLLHVTGCFIHAFVKTSHDMGLSPNIISGSKPRNVVSSHRVFGVPGRVKKRIVNA